MIRSVEPLLVRKVLIFDVYTGDQVPKGEKSLAIGVVLQADDRTLKDAEAQTLSEKIITLLDERFRARLRG